jgi:hypothetical protein
MLKIKCPRIRSNLKLNYYDKHISDLINTTLTEEYVIDLLNKFTILGLNFFVNSLDMPPEAINISDSFRYPQQFDYFQTVISILRDIPNINTRTFLQLIIYSITYNEINDDFVFDTLTNEESVSKYLEKMNCRCVFYCPVEDGIIIHKITTSAPTINDTLQSCCHFGHSSTSTSTSNVSVKTINMTNRINILNNNPNMFYKGQWLLDLGMNRYLGLDSTSPDGMSVPRILTLKEWRQVIIETIKSNTIDFDKITGYVLKNLVITHLAWEYIDTEDILNDIILW